MQNNKTLIIMLGRPYQGGYQKTDYKMPDGTLYQEKHFVGHSLFDWIKPEKLVVLGTSGSMWDELLRQIDNVDEALYLEVAEAVEANDTSQELLDRLSEHLSQLLSKTVVLKILTLKVDEESQVEFVQQLSDVCTSGTELHMDITHGFRTLPLFALTAAFYLKKLKKIDIKAVYYAEFRPDEKCSVVHDLKGLITIMSGVSILEKYDHSGDYGLLGELVNTDSDKLKDAAFFERITNANKASSKLKAFMENWIPDATGKLFESELLTRFKWSKRSAQHLRELSLAREYLNRNDYVRAVFYGLEGLVSQSLNDQKIVDTGFDVRHDASNQLAANEHYRKLRAIRNALAHGSDSGKTRQKEDVKKALTSSAEMQKVLNQLFNELGIR
jgi:CRISPR-associated Csx2 family protein